jgi:hypothetical protein
VSGAGTRKSRNLAQNANCVVSMSLLGIDLVIEGTAVRVRDDESAVPPLGGQWSDATAG